MPGVVERLRAKAEEGASGIAEVIKLVLEEGIFVDEEFDSEDGTENALEEARSFIRLLKASSGISRWSSKSDAIVDMHFRSGVETRLRLQNEPCVLRNPESLCYMTSVLEMLSLVRPFVQRVVQVNETDEALLKALALVFAVKAKGLQKDTEVETIFDLFKQEFRSDYVSVEISKDAASYLADLIKTFRKYGYQELIEGFSATTRNSLGKTELLVTLPVSLRRGHLSEALADFFIGQKLDDGTALTAKMLTVPPYLMCHLKRFRLDTSSYSKDNSRFDYDEVIDFAPFVATPSAPSYKYRLAGVIVHEGSVTDGHYFNYSKYSSANGEGAWYCINDTTKQYISDFSEVWRRTCGGEGDGEGSAYMLLYESETAAIGHHEVVLSEHLSTLVEDANDELCVDSLLGYP